MRVLHLSSPLLFIATAVLVASGCNQVHVGFARFQLVNQTPYSITYYGIALSEAGVKNAPNRLDAPIAPGTAFDGNVSNPGNYWLRAIAQVDGQPVERITGPVHIFDGNRAWAWYLEGDSLKTGTEPADIYAVTDLPAVVINTNAQAVVDDPKVRSTMHASFDPEGGVNWPLGEPVDFDGFAGIEVRGNSSQTFPKKSFGVETWDEEDEGINVELLGFPEEEDWVFYGPWMDRSLMRNVIGYSMWGNLGYYSPRTRYIDLYLNTDNIPVVEETYYGVYVLTEKIKRDDNRVDISRLREEHTEEPEITGGYILEMVGPDQIDQGAATFDVAGDFVISIDEPDPEDIPAVQRQWITDYIADFEAALFGPNFTDPNTGYAAYIDVDSFVDYILIQEFYKNRDGFRSSTWMSKDREGKLTMGPVWDLDICFGYFSFSGFQDPEGFYLNEAKNDLSHSPWTDRLFEDPAFVEKCITRWQELRQGPFSLPAINALIDESVATLKTAHVRNFVRWNSLGKTLLPDINFLMFLGPHPESWQGEVQYLREWTANRAEWIDANIASLRK